MPKARAQRWHPRSLAAGKYRKFQGFSYKPLKSCENPGSPAILFHYVFFGMNPELFRAFGRSFGKLFAISASVAPASASRLTAVPRRSLNVTPVTPAALHAFFSGSPKAISAPDLPIAAAKDRTIRPIEARLERSTYRNDHMNARLVLLQPDHLPVIL